MTLPDLQRKFGLPRPVAKKVRHFMRNHKVTAREAIRAVRGK